MSLGEFDLIKRYFQPSAAIDADAGVSLGIGDDCAILDVPDGYQLAVTTDSLVAGVHFFEDVCPYRLGYKSLAVNLSDLAAMGATPKWVSLAITLAHVDEHWLSEFSRGFFALANKYNIALIGGDTTKGPLSITVSAKGIVPRHKALLRSAAKPGDLVCVSGVIGDGAVGLASKLENLQLNDSQAFIDALELTEPRIELGQLLCRYASSCIDISDGLLQDLGHITEKSDCVAKLQLDKLPLSVAVQKEVQASNLSKQQAYRYALTGGDDYELLFTLNASALKQLQQAIIEHNHSSPNPITFTVIGDIIDSYENNYEDNQEQKIHLFDEDQAVQIQGIGWDHFK